MSSDVVIQATGLGKAYHIYKSPQDRLAQMFFFSGRKFFQEFDAVKDVTFTIKTGETVGIVGRNGSGKSTLLQLVSGILRPTSGCVEVRGRIAALLELGAGFNAELTGRENVVLYASVLGLSDQEVKNKYEAIVSFSGVGEFIERPLKTYSSGMMARLAFSVAVNVEPDLLIVDETLAVGDEVFQRKCFAKIEEIKASGTTILFVSHSAQMVSELCDRAILMENGHLLLDGTPKLVIKYYHKLLFSSVENYDDLVTEIRTGCERVQKETKKTTVLEPYDFYDPSLTPQNTVVYDSKGALIDRGTIVIKNKAGEKVNILKAGNTYVYSYVSRIISTCNMVRAGTLIKSVTGVELFGIQSHAPGDGIASLNANEEVLFEFEFTCRLLQGVYFMNAGLTGIVDGAEVFLHRMIDVYAFKVVSEEKQKISGIVDLSVGQERNYFVN